MKKIFYPSINETLYTGILDNGLEVTLLPKPDFHKTYGLFTTNYGSIDNEFIPLGHDSFTKVPDGIAHFLEHKLFEKEDEDVFQKFGRQGASSNAFTSFTRTSYLFSSTDNMLKNIQTLIDFVQDPYFTEESVNKEKGIIGQEIQMYQDDPNWRLYFGILNNLYPKHPLHIDIAGTEESISHITAEDLYLCYNTFYHPSNMNIFIVGKMDPEQLMQFIIDNQNQKEFVKAQPIERRFPVENAKDIIKEDQINLSVSRPKAIVGLKGLDDVPEDGFERLKYQTTLQLLLQLLFGDTSESYLNMYNEGLIDDSFSFEFTLDRSFHFADFSTDTNEPERFANQMINLILKSKDSPELTERNLNLAKRKMMGKHLKSLDSLEYIANQFSGAKFGDTTLFDLAEIIDSIELDDLLAAQEAFVRPEGLSRFFIYPK
ncbi:EF-P 5-aminopentanol modification-associated protein YfmH [Vagococcus carniphilus]|uniref:Pitrilysin family protein n=1 Tax=Vagococcus carniphilus TaxID=218144 RepID=A0AAW8U783_9ENTE|nr:pitrilysin family protein [Vagococcus carniphilus]MDT2814899.1 pitrilysin family protein [Vagococcus carniphilus]MDT2834157.1 pitrilysin family protein [Vagococcus carniphilus]MDT2866169.1 pitrilysin family protein [Vagococcus carniphilus]